MAVAVAAICLLSSNCVTVIVDTPAENRLTVLLTIVDTAAFPLE